VPFITEGIFGKLNETAPVRKLNGIADTEISAALVIAQWPRKIDSLIDTDAEKQIEITQAAIRAIRDLRSQYNKVPSEKLTTSANSPQEVADILNQNAGLICHLAGLKEFSASRANAKPKNAAATIVEQMQIYLHEAIDPGAEHGRLEKQKEQLEKLKSGIEAKLENPNFVNKARADVVEQTRGKLAEVAEQLRTIEKHLLELKG
jgi:valyl-tRNA synthetase